MLMGSPVLEYLLTDDGLVPPIQSVADTPTPKPSTREEIFAVANTAHLLDLLGAPTEVTEEDEAQAREIFESGRVPNTYERTLPGVMLKLESLLSAYDHELLADAKRIRNYVANKLVEETQDPDPRIRLKAYELLGKITEVGLFTERSEVQITHKPSEELESLLREKLSRLTPKIIEHEDPAAEMALRAITHVRAADVC